MSPRTGRPTTNPRPNKLSIRISDEDKEGLERYCEMENVNKTEAVSRGIKALEEELENAEIIKKDLERALSKPKNPQVPEEYKNALELDKKLEKTELLIEVCKANLQK